MIAGWKPIAAAAGGLVLLVGLIAAVAGRSGADGAATGDKASGSAPSVTEGSAEAPEAVGAWRTAGLTVSAFTASDAGKVGGTCEAGTVSGVDVKLCTFDSPDAAKAAQAAGRDAIGEHTGLALTKGAQLLIAIDARNADPTGRTLNQLAKSFTGK
ncbi:MAG: hypothetical protein K8W52_04925 [Deltaproteobacteria bacterium]|nr:hypothetical protein [Deltaproteobacteria bacterium]